MKKEIEEQVGWLASECGREDVEIRKLEQELKRRKTRRMHLWDRCTKLETMLQEMSKEEKSNGKSG